MIRQDHTRGKAADSIELGDIPAGMPVRARGVTVIGPTSSDSRCCFHQRTSVADAAISFIGLPLKWREGTASPIRAVAVFGL